MFRRTLVVVVCLLSVSVSALGETMKVTFKDGRRPLTGEVEKIDGGKQYKITVFVGGKPVMVQTVKAEEIRSMVKVTTPTDEYQQRLKKIDPNSALHRFKLGEWAFGAGLLKIAVHELETALKLRPDYETAALLLKQVKARIASGGGNGGTRPTNGGGAITSDSAERKLMITEHDLNRVRLGELADAPFVGKIFLGRRIEFRGKESARVTPRNKVVSRFVDMMRNDEDFRVDPKAAGDAFGKWKSHEQFCYMLSRLDRSDWAMKDDLVVKTDPSSMRTFHRVIWPMLTKSCGSTACHGAPKGQGKLKLFNIKANDTLGLYSNFLILEMYARDRYRMIYRDHPAESLLLEAALPRKDAKWKHPEKAKATPLFTGVTDARYKTALTWIESLRGPPRPFYGVKYLPPFGPDPEATSVLKSAKPARP